jgi:SAM-dependent methyltransferase
VYGSEANADSAQWCKASLPKVKTQRNSTLPPLSYDNKTFDFIFAKSVFSHLPESPARDWIIELARIVNRDGIVILTFNGRPVLDSIIRSEEMQRIWQISEQRARVIATNLGAVPYVYIPGHDLLVSRAGIGAEYGHTFIDQAWFHAELQKAGLDVVKSIPGMPGQQDTLILRSP